MEPCKQIRKYSKCAACGIAAFRVDDEKPTFMARFPLDLKRCKEWVRVIGRKELANLSVHRLHYSRFVCKRHFQEKDFTLSKSRLKRDTVPSVNLFTKPLSPELLKGFGKNPIHAVVRNYTHGAIFKNNVDSETKGREIEVTDTQFEHEQYDQNTMDGTDTVDSTGIDEDHNFETELETIDPKIKINETSKKQNEPKVNKVLTKTTKSARAKQKALGCIKIVIPLEMPIPAGLHNDLLQIRWLAGTWETKNGLCQYPTIEDFEYHEEMEFICIGQPMFNYISKAMHPEKGIPMHQERGFLRIKPGTNQLAFMVSHNFGLTSLEEGHFDELNQEIELATVSISRMSSAKPPKVLSFKRNIKLLDPNTLRVTVYMETENTELCKHLEAMYSRKA